MRYEKASFIVTGASLGVGHALAVELAKRGASLVLSARTPETLQQASEDCIHAAKKAGFATKHIAVPGSCANPETAATLVRKATEIGRFSGLFHCAGVLHPGPLSHELDPERFAEVFEAGPIAAQALAHAAYPKLLETTDAVAVFLGSGAAERTQTGIGPYCAAKAAQEHLVRQLAAETPQITAFNYRPGIVDTRMQTQARETTEGGGADAIHAVFRPWKENNELISPETSARALLMLLDSGPHHLHATTPTWRDA